VPDDCGCADPDADADEETAGALTLADEVANSDAEADEEAAGALRLAATAEASDGERVRVTGGRVVAEAVSVTVTVATPGSPPADAATEDEAAEDAEAEEVAAEDDADVEAEAAAEEEAASLGELLAASMSAEAERSLVHATKVPGSVTDGRAKHCCVFEQGVVTHLLSVHCANASVIQADSPLVQGSEALRDLNWVLSFWASRLFCWSV